RPDGVPVQRHGGARVALPLLGDARGLGDRPRTGVAGQEHERYRVVRIGRDAECTRPRAERLARLTALRFGELRKVALEARIREVGLAELANGGADMTERAEARTYLACGGLGVAQEELLEPRTRVQADEIAHLLHRRALGGR